MVEKIDKPKSRRALQKNVDLSFYAIVIRAMHELGLHAVGTGLPAYRCAEHIREGQERAVYPSADAVQLVVDELAGRPILPTRRAKS